MPKGTLLLPLVITALAQLPGQAHAGPPPHNIESGTSSSWAIGREQISIREGQRAIALSALSYTGTDYRYGGETRASGVDCSALVRNVYREALGIALPRTAIEQSRTGLPIPSAAPLQVGDLVFFHTLESRVSHVGLYLGRGQFVHAPTTGAQVRVEDMSRPYWRARFTGARRLLTDAPTVITRKTPVEALHRGDLLLVRDGLRSRVAVYLGEGRAIHATGAHPAVRIRTLDTAARPRRIDPLQVSGMSPAAHETTD